MGIRKKESLRCSLRMARALVFAVFLPAAIHARPQDTSSNQESLPGIEVPRGTILPIRLSTSLSSEKSAAGQRITAKLMQSVPLNSRKEIRRGSTVAGKVVAVSPLAGGTGAEISFRFDELRMGSRTARLTTNLRAIASFLEVEEAEIPTHASGESEVYDWLPTTQIGGDNVFGKGGPVTKWNDSSEVVGKATMEGGVLVRISARPGTSCRGPLYGNDAPQALWVFSSDACGVYGMAHLAIADAGRGVPAGLIVLRSSVGKLNLPSGTAMLLRVDDTGQP